MPEEKKAEKTPVQKEQKSLLGDLPPLMLNAKKSFETQAEYK
jgi:hypothetical protein